jgi:hypothetical protein
MNLSDQKNVLNLLQTFQLLNTRERNFQMHIGFIINYKYYKFSNCILYYYSLIVPDGYITIHRLLLWDHTAMKRMACNKSRWKAANQSNDWRIRRRRRRRRFTYRSTYLFSKTHRVTEYLFSQLFHRVQKCCLIPRGKPLNNKSQKSYLKEEKISEEY